MKYKIYSDGSHKNKQSITGGRLGCGAVLLGEDGNLIDEISVELTQEQLIKDFEITEAVSNPTAEMLGVYYALKNFNIPKGSDVEIYADYIGVKSWMTGKWSAKEVYIQKIQSAIKLEILKKHLRRVQYKWVKGHQRGNDPDTYWNNYVDSLAKGEK